MRPTTILTGTTSRTDGRRPLRCLRRSIVTWRRLRRREGDEATAHRARRLLADAGWQKDEAARAGKGSNSRAPAHGANKGATMTSAATLDVHPQGRRPRPRRGTPWLTADDEARYAAGEDLIPPAGDPLMLTRH
jgi:hypothetical protein